jgi:hypothetical protein
MKLVNDTILLQHVYSNSEHARLIALTAPRTIRYCMKHKIDYRLVFGEVDGDNHDGGHWANINLMRDYMDMGYENIIYLDADTMIADLDTDLRKAISPGMIGAVWHNLIRGENDYSHYNAGAYYVSNTESTRAFVGDWLSAYPGVSIGWPVVYEQGTFMTLGKEWGIINRLNNRWNAEEGVSPSNNPVILGFHGFPDLYNNMQKTLAELERTEALCTIPV